MKRFLSIMLVLFIIPTVLLFAGCVSSIEDMAGTYEFAELYSEGKTYKVGDSFNDVALSETSAVLVLNNDETFSATYTDLDCGIRIDGIWDRRENMISFVSTGFETIELNFEIKKDGSLLLIINSNAILLFTKKQVL